MAPWPGVLAIGRRFSIIATAPARPRVGQHHRDRARAQTHGDRPWPPEALLDRVLERVPAHGRWRQ